MIGFGLFARFFLSNKSSDCLETINDYILTTKKSWDDYVLHTTGLSMQELVHNQEKLKQLFDDSFLISTNLRSILNGISNCFGNAEVIRNLGHYFNIVVKNVTGVGHTWNQVYLDGIWYDDDFTQYSPCISTGNYTHVMVLKNFLRGYSIEGDKKIRDITRQSIHNFSSDGEVVGNSLTPTEICDLFNDTIPIDNTSIDI